MILKFGDNYKEVEVTEVVLTGEADSYILEANFVDSDVLLSQDEIEDLEKDNPSWPYIWKYGKE